MISGVRIVVTLVVLVNLVLTVALIAQVREMQQKVASLPPDLATKRDVASLRPLPIRQILTENCVGCHTARRLGTTASLEPAQLQSAIARMQSHPGADIKPNELERITASMLVLRCARCHDEATVNLMVLKTQPERIATIRRMAALPGSGVRPDQVAAIAQAFETLVALPR
jgi:hypothetical protein